MGKILVKDINYSTRELAIIIGNRTYYGTALCPRGKKIFVTYKSFFLNRKIVVQLQETNDLKQGGVYKVVTWCNRFKFEKETLEVETAITHFSTTKLLGSMSLDKKKGKESKVRHTTRHDLEKVLGTEDHYRVLDGDRNGLEIFSVGETVRMRSHGERTWLEATH